MTIFHQRPERILNRLVRGGLIVPLRGPGGGFVLAKPAAKVTRAEVFSAAGRQELTVPSLHSYCGEERVLTAACRARPVWLGLQRLTDSFLRDTTLAAICPGRGGKRIAPHRRLRS